MTQFRPLPLLGHPAVQTLVGNLTPAGPEPPSETVFVRLDDGDRLALEVSTPPGWAPPDPTVVLVHGLTGSHRSPHLVRWARRLFARGARVARVNLRGQGSGERLAKRPYHAGASGDVLSALEHLRGAGGARRGGASAGAAAGAGSPTALVGVSLGGNIALKLAGELGPDGPRLLAHVTAVCPAVDLAACVARMDGTAVGRPFALYFVRALRAEHRRRQAAFADLPRVEPPASWSLRAFDDQVTAPAVGYQGVDDYYARASSAPLIARIAVPTKLLYAEDDPVIDPGPIERLAPPPCVERVAFARGGHVGFVGWGASARGRRGLAGLLARRGGGDARWLDHVVPAWVEEALARADGA